jgi:hypothetical protein
MPAPTGARPAPATARCRAIDKQTTVVPPVNMNSDARSLVRSRPVHRAGERKRANCAMYAGSSRAVVAAISVSTRASRSFSVLLPTVDQLSRRQPRDHVFRGRDPKENAV